MENFKQGSDRSIVCSSVLVTWLVTTGRVWSSEHGFSGGGGVLEHWNKEDQIEALLQLTNQEKMRIWIKTTQCQESWARAALGMQTGHEGDESHDNILCPFLCSHSHLKQFPALQTQCWPQCFLWRDRCLHPYEACRVPLLWNCSVDGNDLVEQMSLLLVQKDKELQLIENTAYKQEDLTTA